MNKNIEMRTLAQHRHNSEFGKQKQEKRVDKVLRSKKRSLNSSGSDATGVPPREPSGTLPSVSGEILARNHVQPISLPLLEMDFAQSFSAVQYREASRSWTVFI